MGSVRLPATIPPDERTRVFGAVGTWAANEEGAVVYSDATRDDATLAALVEAEWGATLVGQPLPAALRGAQAARIKAAAELSDAQIDGATAAGAERRMAYDLRAVCRALVYLVDRRLGED